MNDVFKANISYNKRKSSIHNETVEKSSLVAGRNMNIKSKNGSISISGTDVKVGNDLDLSTKKDITIKASEENYTLSNSSSQMGIGLSADLSKGKIADLSISKVETKGMVAKEATEDTLAAIRNNLNVITGDEGKNLAESIPMDRREYYKALMFNISATKLIVGAGIEAGVIYNKDPITGKEEFGYVLGGKGLFGFDYNAKKINDIGKVALKVDWGFDSYEKKGKPIKDFQGMTAKVEGSIGLFGVGASGEIDVKDNDKISGSVGGEDTRFKAMVTLGYRRVNEFKNPGEDLKNAIRAITNNSETTAETIQGIRMIIDAIKKAEELKK